MTQGIPCGFKIQWQSIHQEPQSISCCFQWGWVSSIDCFSLPELNKALFMMAYFMIACWSGVRKTSIESNCHIYQKDIWILEEAILLPGIYQNWIKQKKSASTGLEVIQSFS